MYCEKHSKMGTYKSPPWKFSWIKCSMYNFTRTDFYTNVWFTTCACFVGSSRCLQYAEVPILEVYFYGSWGPTCMVVPLFYFFLVSCFPFSLLTLLQVQNNIAGPRHVFKVEQTFKLGSWGRRRDSQVVETCKDNIIYGTRGLDTSATDVPFDHV